ncbi:amino acid ABC transporter ATP-binding protein [Devosia sp. 2618]|uniref:amino acid ABC transporter ATP-binding protein n=1 Tax=Devosia sp. 2618 TaxID=3156454 RepID=UPI0033992A15
MSAPVLSLSQPTAWPIDISRVSKVYNNTLVLDDVSVSIEAGSVCALIGPSGSGKSTLLRCINGLVDFEGGRVKVGDIAVGEVGSAGGARPWTEREASQLRRHIGIVFQQFNLFPHRTVLDNVTEAQQLVLGRSRDEAVEKAMGHLRRVELADRAQAFPGELSGGQQQRVAIARALAMDPSVILFDEVTSALDPELALEVGKVVRDLSADGTTMVVVTHELDFARDVADMVVLLERGRVVEAGTAEQIFRSPRNPRTAAFVAHSTST